MHRKGEKERERGEKREREGGGRERGRDLFLNNFEMWAKSK
jgi:hypothetical protein